jgi:hypothetical protein
VRRCSDRTLHTLGATARALNCTLVLEPVA